MLHSRYALVAYVRNHVGEFVESLRRELHPSLPYFSAHLSVLPPRCIKASEALIGQYLEEACNAIQPFEVELGDVASFVPVTPTLFIQVWHGAYRMRELHDQLHRADLFEESEWLYMPHLTIAKMDTNEQAKAGFALADRRWREFAEGRRLRIEELTFVREEAPNRWVDLASVRLGHSLAGSSG
jgi:2'-5' RNA ligase